MPRDIPAPDETLDVIKGIEFPKQVGENLSLASGELEALHKAVENLPDWRKEELGLLAEVRKTDHGFIYGCDEGYFETEDGFIKDQAETALSVFNFNMEQFMADGKSFEDLYEDEPRWIYEWLTDSFIGEYLRDKYQISEEQLNSIGRKVWFPEEQNKIDVGSEQIEKYRKEINVGPASPESGNTVAVVTVDGKPYFGTNSSITPEMKEETRGKREEYREKVSYSPPKEQEPTHLGLVQSLVHAESYALIMAYEGSGNALPEKMEMYVDRKTCNMCRGEMPSLLKFMGVKELTIYSKDMLEPLIISAKE